MTQVEQQWCGRTLAIGETVRLRVSVPTQRCGMIAFHQAELPKDLDILRCVTHDAHLHFGVYADVIQPGRVVLGDHVQIVD